MSKPLVYLAGPISHTTETQAFHWRRFAQGHLEKHGIVCISPLRNEQPSEAGGGFGGPELLHPEHRRAIAAKNTFDTRNCDLVLCYMPISMTPLSVGSLIELALAYAWNKPAVLVTDDPSLIHHPLVQQCAGWIVPKLSDGLEVITGLLRPYASAHTHP